MQDSAKPPADDAPGELTLIFVRDLMFSTRIVAAAREAGVPFKVIRDASVLAAHPGNRLFVDLNQPGAIEAAGEWGRNHPGQLTIGFVSHVDHEAIAQARAAGISTIVSRGEFVARLPQLVSE